MPYYDYRCKECGHVEEVFHSMNEVPDIVCECGGQQVEKLFGNTTVFVKGYGWLDAKGRQRDMNLHTLMNNDPYAHIRPPGDKEETAAKLRRAGKVGYDEHGNKKSKSFTVKKS